MDKFYTKNAVISIYNDKTMIGIHDAEINEMLSEAYLAFGDEACEMLSENVVNSVRCILKSMLDTRDEILRNRGCE